MRHDQAIDVRSGELALSDVLPAFGLRGGLALLSVVRYPRGGSEGADSQQVFRDQRSRESYFVGVRCCTLHFPFLLEDTYTKPEDLRSHPHPFPPPPYPLATSGSDG